MAEWGPLNTGKVGMTLVVSTDGYVIRRPARGWQNSPRRRMIVSCMTQD